MPSKLEQKDVHYYYLITNKGNQDDAWDEYTKSADPDDEEILRVIKAREAYLNDGKTPPVNHCASTFIGVSSTGTGGCEIINILKAKECSQMPWMVEWMGNLYSFNDRCILVDNSDNLIEEEWLHKVAEEYKKSICTVRPVSELCTNTEGAIGAEYAVEIWDHETKYYSALFGTEDVCWEWAAALSCMVFVSSEKKELNLNFIYESERYIPVARRLAVAGGAGSGTNKLIKKGWGLADCVQDIRDVLGGINPGYEEEEGDK